VKQQQRLETSRFSVLPTEGEPGGATAPDGNAVLVVMEHVTAQPQEPAQQVRKLTGYLSPYLITLAATILGPTEQVRQQFLLLCGEFINETESVLR
jgi:hypothetical protein